MTQADRASRLEWVRIGDLQVSPKAQRELRESHVKRLASSFDLEKVGFPVLNKRGDTYWVVDGQHRIAALKLNEFTDDDLIECEVYEGLSEAEEAELFLGRDERRAITGFDKFRIGLVAGRADETQIERIVTNAGLKISLDERDGCIAAVAALRFVHSHSPVVLQRTIDFLMGAFGEERAAFTSEMLKGTGLVAQRYNGEVSDEHLRRLAGAGPLTLKRKAEQLKLKTGHTMPNCMAGAIVDVMNHGRGGSKLESWWR